MAYDIHSKQRSRLDDMQRRADELRAEREASGVAPDATPDDIAEADKAAKRKRLALLIAIEAIVAIAIVIAIVAAVGAIDLPTVG